jgi:replicative DNA helicase
MSDLQNHEAEKAIIHILLHCPEMVAEVDNTDITYFDFTKNVFSELYQVVKQLYLDGVTLEPASVFAKGREMGFRFVRSSKNVKSIEVLFKKKAPPTNLRTYCGIVKNLSMRAMLLHKLDEAKAAVLECDTAIEAVNRAERMLYDFADGSAQEHQTIKLGTRVEAILKQLEKDPAIGLSTGFPTYDKLIGGGPRRGSIHIIGARPKKGKSQVGLAISLHNALLGIPTLYLDTELEDVDQGVRMAGILAQIPYDELETGRWRKVKEYVEAYKKIKKQLPDLPLHWIKVAGMTIDEIVGIIRRFAVKDVGLCEDGKYRRSLVCYDYLKLTSAKDLTKQMQEHQVLGYRMSELHDLMGQYGASMVMTLQLNRDGIDREDEAAASQSDRIIWLCDSFTIFKPLSPEELSITHGESNHKLFVSAVRHGRPNFPGEFIGIYADKRFGHFKDMGLVKVLKSDEDEEEGDL